MLHPMLISEQLLARPEGVIDQGAINVALLKLTRLTAESPQDMLQHLAEEALALCRCHSAGVSVIEVADGEEVFKWHGIAGRLAAGRGLGMPRHDSPCGMVVDQQLPLLVEYPERHYTYPAAIEVPIVEALLTPFYSGGEAVGTVWIIAHDGERKFDRADLHALRELGSFASHAHSLLTSMGYLRRPAD